jgi:hypothetical protein
VRAQNGVMAESVGGGVRGGLVSTGGEDRSDRRRSNRPVTARVLGVVGEQTWPGKTKSIDVARGRGQRREGRSSGGVRQHQTRSATAGAAADGRNIAGELSKQ